METHPVAKARVLHAIAMLEAVKGVVVLAASIGMLSLFHHDMRHLLHEILRHMSINPHVHYPTMFLRLADVLENADLRLLVLFAIGYASVRLFEAYGLWKDLAWGEWLGALSGAIYFPFEIHHFIYKPSLAGAGLFLINLFIVGFLALRLYRRRSPSRIAPWPRS